MDARDWAAQLDDLARLEALEAHHQEGLRLAQDAIAAGAWADNVRADNWAGKAVASVLDLNADDASDRKRISALLALWKKNGCLKTETRHNARTGRDQAMIVVGEVF